jgi:hypothetical protein
MKYDGDAGLIDLVFKILELVLARFAGQSAVGEGVNQSRHGAGLVKQLHLSSTQRIIRSISVPCIFCI